MYFRDLNGQWTKLDPGFEMSGFHHNVLGNFLSLRIALNATGVGNVKFSEFSYRAGTPDGLQDVRFSKAAARYVPAAC